MLEPQSATDERLLANREGPYVHIDTTLQIERQRATNGAQTTNRALAAFKFQASSTYARHEFNRTLIRDLAYLVAKSKKTNSVGNLLGEITRSFGTRQSSKNRLTRCIGI